jgi:putative serine protease PepD
MTDDRFDLGRPAGPDFLPVQDSPAPAARPSPAVIATRIRTGVTEPPAVPDSPVPPAPHGRRAGRLAALATACLTAAAGAGAGAGYLVAVSDAPSAIRQHQPGASGSGSLPDAQAAADALLPAVVAVSAGTSRGSGFAIDDAGHVMTNSHVVQGFSRVLVRMPDDRQTTARVVGTDPATDVAVLAPATRHPRPPSG